MGAIIRLDERHARAYVSEPLTTPRGRVLVVHDAYGLLPHIRFLCDQLAGAHFVALAPDLFAGVSTRSDAQASRLLEQLDPERAERVLRAAVQAFDTLGQTDGRCAVVGFSTGAEFALPLVTTGDVATLVCYYAAPDVGPAMPPTAVLTHWAEHDEWDGNGPDATVAALTAAGADVVSHVYPSTIHGFANADLEQFDLDAAELAWHRTVGFLRDRMTG